MQIADFELCDRQYAISEMQLLREGGLPGRFALRLRELGKGRWRRGGGVLAVKLDDQQL